jgi:MFS family permease
MFIGTIVIWNYLNKSGLDDVISPIISSPQILLTTAIYSLLVSTGVVFIVVLVPAIIRFCENFDELKWKEKPEKNRFTIHFLLILLPLFLLMISGWLQISGKFIVLMYMSTGFLISCIFYKAYNGPESINCKDKIKHFSVVLLGFFLILSMLFLTLLFFFKVTLFVEKNETLQWIILFAILLTYSATVALASSSSGYILYFPIVFLSFVILVFLFADTASTNIVSRLGIGGYITSYAVERKNLEAISSDNSYSIENTNNERIAILSDVWVKIVLPDKIILSAKSGSLETYSIPKSAILGELRNVKKSM